MQPLDVQAERLRELAEAAKIAPGMFNKARAQLADACSPSAIVALLDLLAGQAEQIDQLTKERDEALRQRQVVFERKQAAVRQRDNLRDAAQQTITALDKARIWHYDRGNMETVYRIDFAIGATLSLREALRAAAVGEDTE